VSLSANTAVLACKNSGAHIGRFYRIFAEVRVDTPISKLSSDLSDFLAYVQILYVQLVDSWLSRDDIRIDPHITL
jgi:hypothetical protein